MVNLELNLGPRIRAAKTNTPAAAETDRRQRWLEENREAIDQYNARIERDGADLSALSPVLMAWFPAHETAVVL